MITEDKINKLYLYVNKNITTKELNEMGFNSKDINKLIKMGYIKRIKRGNYEFTLLETLFNESKRLYSEKNFDLANKYLNKCFLIEPNNQIILRELFFRNLMNYNFDDALHYFILGLESKGQIFKVDKLILYLFSNLVDLPDKYKNIVDDIDKEKFINAFSDDDKIIVSMILNNKYSSAIKKINSNTKNMSLNIILKRLCFKLSQVYNINRNNVLELVKQKNYEEVLKFYEQSELTKKDIYVKKIIEDILYIKNNNNIPKVTSLKANNVFDAIDKKLYEEALNYSISYNSEFNKMNNNDLLYVLLNDIVNLKKEVSGNKKRRVLINNIYKKNTYNLINNKFKNREIDNNLFRLVNKYLGLYNLNSFDIVIINLIKIDTLNNNFSYDNVRNILYEFLYDNFIINIDDLIYKFYESITNNNVEVAGLYLEIFEVLKSKCNVNLNINSLKDEVSKLKLVSDNEIIDINMSNYGLKSVDVMFELIDTYEDFDNVGIYFGLNKYETNILKLIYARCCYVNSNYFIGNYLIRQVENSEYLNEDILGIIDEIKINKFNYNRISLNDNFVLKLIKSEK